MTQSQLVPKVVDEIEFYISDDGKHLGMSISGLAKLCGIGRPGLSDTLNRLSEPSSTVSKSSPKSLESLRGKVFNLSVVGVNGAKIIPSQVCARIIRYYAYESSVQNEVAKFSFEKFADMGMDLWIKQVTGFSNTSGIANQEVVNLLRVLDEKVTTLTEITTEYKNIKNVTTVTFPNLDKMLDDLKDSELLEFKDTKTNRIPLVTWLANKGVSLDKSAFHRFASLVSDTYKSTVGKAPPKISIKLASGRYRANICGYCPEEFPVLEMCLRKLLLDS